MLTKVMVVDDSIMMRATVVNIVKSDPDLEVVGKAKNGREALEEVGRLRPDVILLDVEMPEMDGLEFLKRVKLISPARVIMVSSLTTKDSPQTREALRLGAVATIDKPSGSVSMDLRQMRGHEIVKAVRRAVGLAV